MLRVGPESIAVCSRCSVRSCRGYLINVFLPPNVISCIGVEFFNRRGVQREYTSDSVLVSTPRGIAIQPIPTIRYD